MDQRRSEGHEVTEGAVGYHPQPPTANTPATPTENPATSPTGASHAPEAGTTHDRVYAERPAGEKSPDEIARDIRHTRAEMSETVDAIERKLSPAHLKHELKESMHEGVDYLRHRLDPRRIAKNTGRSMLDTIKENPLPSLIAGLSIGWLIMNGNEHDEDRWDDYDTRARTRYYGRGYNREPRYNPEGYYPAGAAYAGDTGYGTRGNYEDSYRTRSYQDFEGDGGSYGRSMKDRAGDKASEVKDRAGEMAGQVQDRMHEMTDEARHRMHDLGHEVRHQTRRTVSGLDRFVHENPLAAGALAVGIGALLGAMLPSTDMEDEWMGDTRDRVVHQARDVAEHTVERSKPIADRVVDEVKDAAREVKDTVKDEARHVAQATKEGAHDVKNEAKHEVRQQT